MSRRRAAALAVSVLSLTGSGCLLALHAQAATVPGSAFYGYTLLGQASGVEVVEDRPTANSHPEGDAEIPLSRVSLQSGPVGYALGTVAWPSALVANAGDLVVFAGNGNVPEELGPPLNEPVRAETRTGGPQEVRNDDYPGVTMRALVRPGEVAADAVLHGAQAGSATGIGSTEAHSTAALGPSTVSSSARSSVRDVSLAGGAVTIRSVVSYAGAQSDGTTATASGRTLVSGLAVGGVPVTVDGDGVHVAGNGTPVDAETVNSVLASLGMRIVLSGPTQTRQGATVTYDSGSLVVYWNPSPEMSLTARLGGARVTAGAFLADPAGRLAPGSTLVIAPGGPGPGGSVPSGTGPAPLSVAVGDGGQAPPRPSGSTAAPAVAGGPPLALALLLAGETAPRGAVALAVLGALALLVGLLRFPLVLDGPVGPACPRRST